MDHAAVAAPSALPPQPAPRLAPTASRLLAIDVARGFALLGIFFVNIQSFGEPFGRFIAPSAESSDALTTLCFSFVKIFCEGKFYPLFSMLFGMGLALQMQSVTSRGGNFYAIYIRRQLWLFIMGLSHALLLWYGDILFVYSIAGLILMLCVRIDPRVLLGIGAALVLFAAALQGGLGSLSGAAAAAQKERLAARTSADAEPAPPETRSPIRQLTDGLQGGPESPDWLEGETRAYRDGPWVQSFLARALTWGMCLVFYVLGFGWHVLGMFFIGAALLKLGLFSAAGDRWHVHLLLLGVLVGLPGAFVSAMLPRWVGMQWWSAGLSGVLLMTCGPLVSLMYLCTFALLVRRGIARPITFVLSNVGRMALTNYLSQTVISTFVFYYWGLAHFGSWSRPERCAFVLGIFACQCIISVLWMRAFRIGPMEWVWRSVTYLRPPTQSVQDSYKHSA